MEIRGKLSLYQQHCLPGANGVDNDIYTTVDVRPSSDPGSHACYPFCVQINVF